MIYPIHDLRRQMLAPLPVGLQERASTLIESLEKEREVMTDRASRLYAQAVLSVQTTRDTASAKAAEIKQVAATRCTQAFAQTRQTAVAYIPQALLARVEALLAQAQVASLQTVRTARDFPQTLSVYSTSALGHTRVMLDQAKESLDERATRLRSNVETMSSGVSSTLSASPVVQSAQDRVAALYKYLVETRRSTEERALLVRGLVHNKVSLIVGSTESLAWNVASAARSNVNQAVESLNRRVPAGLHTFPPLPVALERGRDHIRVAATQFSTATGLGDVLDGIGMRIPLVAPFVAPLMTPVAGKA